MSALPSFRKMLRVAGVFALAAPGHACNRASDDAAADQRMFDSLIARQDTMVGRMRAQKESLAALAARTNMPGLPADSALLKSDSDFREKTPVARVLMPSGGADTVTRRVGLNPAKIAPAPLPPNSMTQRAIALGDSIARADANRLIGKLGSGGTGGDSVRGIIEIRGTAPRLVLKTANRVTVKLSGIATEGIAELNGAEVVVRGLKVSSQDVVVRSFAVRSIKGVAAIDGRLDQNATGWSIALSDNSGIQKLTDVPALLQQVVGARVWVTLTPGSTAPQAYGLIVRR